MDYRYRPAKTPQTGACVLANDRFARKSVGKIRSKALKTPFSGPHPAVILECKPPYRPITKATAWTHGVQEGGDDDAAYRSARSFSKYRTARSREVEPSARRVIWVSIGGIPPNSSGDGETGAYQRNVLIYPSFARRPRAQFFGRNNPADRSPGTYHEGIADEPPEPVSKLFRIVGPTGGKSVRSSLPPAPRPSKPAHLYWIGLIWWICTPTLPAGCGPENSVFNASRSCPYPPDRFSNPNAPYRRSVHNTRNPICRSS